MPVIDFKGEAITFKTTTAAVIDTLEHCAELVAQREESWRRRLEREKERRRQSEVLSQKYFEQLQKSRNVHPGPDLEVNFYHCNVGYVRDLINGKDIGTHLLCIYHIKILLLCCLLLSDVLSMI